MADFVAAQTDYIVFVCGTAFMIIAAICFGLRKTPGAVLAWGWLGAFGLAQGIVVWCGLVGNSLPGSVGPLWLSTFIQPMALACISESGREGVFGGRAKVFGRCLIVSLLAASALGTFTGRIGCAEWADYILGTAGGTLAAIALLRARGNDATNSRRRLALLGAMCMMYTLAEALSVPQAPYSRAYLVDLSRGGAIQGIPVAPIKAALAVTFATILWCHYRSTRDRSACRDDSLPSRCLAAFPIPLILVLGWAMAVYVGGRTDAGLRRELAIRAMTAAAAIDPAQIAALDGSLDPNVKQRHEDILGRLHTLYVADRGCRCVCLMGRRSGMMVPLAWVGRAGSRYFVPPRVSRAYALPKAEELSMGESSTLGPFRGEYGLWASATAPVFASGSEEVMALITLEVDADSWGCNVARNRLACMAVTFLVCLVACAALTILQNKEEFSLRIAASEHRYRSLVETSPNWLSLFDDQNRCLSVNQSGLDTMGWAAEQIIGKSFLDFWPEDIRPVAEDAARRAAAGGTAAFESPCFGPDGRRVIWHVVLNPTAPECRSSARFAAICMNVTKRKEAEAELRIQTSAINAATDLIVITDLHGCILFVNPSFERETGYSSEEAIGASLSLLRSGKHDEAFYAGLWETILAGQTWQGEIVERRKDGSLFTEDMTVTPVKDESGAIQHFIAIQRNITEKRLYQERLDHMAHHDPLTGLPNRLLFSDRLTQRLAQARRDNIGLAVMFLDLDRFKVINDSLGHAVGDMLLSEVARRLTTTLRSADTIARMGGDEFTLIVGDVGGPEDTAGVAQKILDVLSQPFMLEGRELFISASIGVSVFPEDGVDVEALVKNADTAMYRAKEQGRNNYQFYTEALNAAAFEKMALEGDLRNALEDERFVVHYQPRVDMQTGRILGAEALVRWLHPDFGLVPPGEFIALAEETGLIGAITDFVLQSACAQNRAWQDAGLPPIEVAVNISGRQLKRDVLMNSVKAALVSADLEARYLGLELTESTLMENPDLSIGVLTELKNLGVRVAVDDFGTGYSSLSCLKRLPIDAVKIDRSFVQGITTNADDAAIATAAVAMAHSLKLGVIAEGVETVDQLELLRSLGCDEMQGYFIGRPVPAEDFTQVLRRVHIEANGGQLVA